MKKMFFGMVVMSAVAAMAADSTQFGVLKVPSTTQQTIVAIPWLESSTTDSAVCVSNLVLTSGLEAGDYLKYYNGTSYECWKLKEGTGGKYWQSVVQENKDGDYVDSANPSTAALERGKSIILDRCGTPSLADRTVKNYFYIMGKPATGTAKLDLANNAYCLVAPTNLDGDSVAISDLEWKNLESTKEYLYVFDNAGTMITYRYIGTSWLNAADGTIGGTIPRGTGAWFYSTGTGENKSVTL